MAYNNICVALGSAGANRTAETLLAEVQPEVNSRLRQLSSPQLEELVEALLDFATPPDLLTWLQPQSET